MKNKHNIDGLMLHQWLIQTAIVVAVSIAIALLIALAILGYVYDPTPRYIFPQ